MSAQTLNARLGSSRDSLENLAVTLTRAVALELYAYIQCTTPADDIEPFHEAAAGSSVRNGGFGSLADGDEVSGGCCAENRSVFVDELLPLPIWQ